MDVARAAYGAVCYSIFGAKSPQQLNPICALFWLAMLDQQQSGVKLGIKDHKIKYYPPGKDQGSDRMTDGVGRGDLGAFHAALKKVEKFWGSGENRFILDVAKKAQEMLPKLVAPYEDDANLLSSVENYEKILQKVLDGNGGSSLQPNEQAEKRFCEKTLEAACVLLSDENSRDILEKWVEVNQESYLKQFT